MRRLLPLAAVVLSGCVATQRDVLDLSESTDELKHQVTELKTTVSGMQTNQAELTLQMKDLREQLTAFFEQMQQSQGDMRQLSAKLDDMSAAITNKVSSIGASLSEQQHKAAAFASAAASQGTPGELFQAAQVRLAKNNFELAAKGFEEYLSKYPKGTLVDVATFNLGEAYFGLKRWQDAGRQFAIVLEKYPKSEMTPSARLKYALSLINMKKNLDEARQYLESVTVDFPKSPEAKAAATHLKKLTAK